MHHIIKGHERTYTFSIPADFPLRRMKKHELGTLYHPQCTSPSDARTLLMRAVSHAREPIRAYDASLILQQPQATLLPAHTLPAARLPAPVAIQRQPEHLPPGPLRYTGYLHLTDVLDDIAPDWRTRSWLEPPAIAAIIHFLGPP